jgi:hypothetical protein
VGVSAAYSHNLCRFELIESKSNKLTKTTNRRSKIMKTNRKNAGGLGTMTRYKLKMLQLFLLLFFAGAAVANVLPGQAPQFTSISVNGTALTLKAVNGTAGGQFVLLCSTNVNGPWTAKLTGNYDGNGNLNLTTTNIINPAVPQQFYMLKQ